MTRTTTFGFLLLLIVMLAALAAPASATLIVNKYTNEFSASSPYNEQLKLCSCETKADRIVVENTGDFIADFTVRAQSAYPNSIRMAEPTFQLAPKHFKEVVVYIEDSCGVMGTFPYDVIVTNSYGRVQTISRTIRVDRCQTVLLDVTPGQAETGLCKPGTFTVDVTNVGTFPDAFSLDFGPYNGIATLKNKDLYLQPGQFYKQDVNFTFPCTEYGTKQIPFVVYTSKNGIGASVQRSLLVRNEYEYSLDMQTDVSACTQTSSTIPITIDNTAAVPDEITIGLKGPGFASLSHTQFAIGKRENHIVDLAIDAPKGAQGKYTLTVDTADKYGGLYKSRDIKLDLRNCYDATLEMRDTPDSAITGPVKACCGQKTYYVNIRNNGDTEQTYELSLDGPSFFVLDETTVRLAPGQNLNIPIRATLPCNDANYTATVTAWAIAAPHVSVSASITVDSLTQRTCHMVQIDDDEQRIQNDMTVLPIIVKSTGLEGGVYAITTNSTLFRIQEQNITLQPGDQQAVHMAPLVNLTTQERGRYIVQPTFTLVDQGIDYKEHVGVKLADKGLFQRLADWFFGLPWGRLGVCGWALIVLALVLLALVLVLILIYVGRLSIPSMSRFGLTLLKAILIVLILLALIAIAFLRAPGAETVYERVANTTDSTVLEWYQNTDKTIDLGQYFTDPDKDYLSYTVTQPRDIKVNVEDHVLTLTPDHNFAGGNTMVITASDSKGGVTDSPVFILRVIPKRNMGFIDWMHAWCQHIATIFAVLILLVLFLIVLTIKERRQDLRRGNVLVVVPRDEKRATAPARRKAVIVARAPARKAKVVVKTRKPAKGIVIRETKAGGKTVNIEVNAPSQPSQQGPTIVTVPGAKQNEVVYVGAKGGNTVHTPYCMNARRIPRNKRVAFSTKKAAINAGLVPCRLCRPFEGGI